MKKQALIILFLVLFTRLILAEPSINFIYSPNVYVGEEFNATLVLNNFNEGSYDVKIEILNQSHNIAERYFQGEWKSTTYWMNDAINVSDVNLGIFRLNITDDYQGIDNITVKIKSDSFSKDFSGYTININKRTIPNPIQNNSNNPVTNTTNNNSNNPSDSIGLELNWDDSDIRNGEEFEITIDSFNLKDKNYDVKAYIYDDNPDSPLSQTQNENGDWITSTRCYNDFFSGSGDKSKKINLRIKSSELDFFGSAKIGVRLRESGSSTYEKDIVEDIDVLKANQVNNSSKSTSTSTSSISNSNQDKNSVGKVSGTLTTYNTQNKISGNVIRLGAPTNQNSIGENLKTQNNIIYESKNEAIKKYSIYFFAFLCLVLIVLLIFSKTI